MYIYFQISVPQCPFATRMTNNVENIDGRKDSSTDSVHPPFIQP